MTQSVKIDIVFAQIGPRITGIRSNVLDEAYR